MTLLACTAAQLAKMFPHSGDKVSLNRDLEQVKVELHQLYVQVAMAMSTLDESLVDISKLEQSLREQQ